MAVLELVTTETHDKPTANIVTNPYVPPTLPDIPQLGALPEAISLSIDDVTTGVLNGTGVFDKLMQVTKIHLLEEYTKSRIDSSDYAQVYLGALTNIVNQSINYALTKDKTEIELKILQINYEAEVLNRDKLLLEIVAVNSSIALNNTNIAMTERQIEASKIQEINTKEEYYNIALKGESLVADINVSQQQRCKLVEETDNLKNDNGFR